ncbi:outer membrane lipoprotein-sorting protein [Pseudomonas sp. D(2018)]|uniref:outer membrane lipoprotein-sorting protein n=1 Tax=Pseudomonas sp. D(2018) TaxID=2502238 RepID=UPI0010F91F27|nr:outer membrane lipoprotein-sorting protein [Pseudomonas sp. D(2018)]
MLKHFFFGTLSALCLSTAPLLQAADAEQEGHAIARAYDISDAGFRDSRVKVRMVLRNAVGQEVSRDLLLSTLEKDGTDTGDKTLVVFLSPADVRDTALLSHPHVQEADDQWLYLPAIKRVKRISTSNKSGPFVGSEFAFEDFTSQELEKYRYEFVRRDSIGGRPVDVVTRFPRDTHSGYSRQVAYFDVENKQPLRVEFFDRKQELLKTLDLSDYRNQNGIWRPHFQKMVNHQTGKSTDLQMSGYEFGVGLKASDFDSSALNRLK